LANGLERPEGTLFLGDDSALGNSAGFGRAIFAPVAIHVLIIATCSGVSFLSRSGCSIFQDIASLAGFPSRSPGLLVRFRAQLLGAASPDVCESEQSARHDVGENWKSLSVPTAGSACLRNPDMEHPRNAADKKLTP